MLRSAVHFLLWFLNRMMALFHLPVWLYYKLQSPKRCSPVYDDVFFMPATLLADKIRKQELTSLYIVSMYINRARDVNKILNAIVDVRYELALNEAQQADDFVKNSGLTCEELQEKYPLLGLPLTIKESIAVADMSWAAGSYINQKKAERDADVVKLLKAAGAIIYLVSNTPELCMNWETFNYSTGRTLNPYDSRRTCGGSSGGEAALLATCGSLIGIGSDFVGSARGPPSFCGVYGHRTSANLISKDLHIPYVEHHAFTICPIARYTVDLLLLLKCMIPKDKLNEIKLLKQVEPRAIRIFYKFGSGSSFPTSKVNNQIVKAMKKVVTHLQEDGFYTKQAELQSLEDQCDITFITLFSDVKGGYEAFSYRNVSVLTELVRTLFCCPRIVLSVLLFSITYKVYKILGNDKLIERNRKLLQEMKAEIDEMLGDDGVLLYPTLPNVANVHGKVYSKTIDTCYMGIINVLDLASTVVPIGKDSDGLPIGIQIISKQKNDRISLAMARYMEMSFGGWAPPLYSSTH